MEMTRRHALAGAAALAASPLLPALPAKAAAPMADLRLFARRSFAATGFVAFAISATVIGMIIYLSLYVQNTLGYSPVQAGLRFLPLTLASFTVALLTGRLIGKVAMRVLLGVAMAAAAAGLGSGTAGAEPGSAGPGSGAAEAGPGAADGGGGGEEAPKLGGIPPGPAWSP